MLFFLKRAFWFVKDHWKLFAIGLAILIVVIFVYRACNKPPKIDLETVNKINTANEKERKAELQRVIEENAEVINTVDNRSTIAETNVVERDRLIAEKVKDADKKIQEAKQGGKDVTQEQLECILTGVC